MIAGPMAADSVQQEARQTPDGIVSPLSLFALSMIFVLLCFVARLFPARHRCFWTLGLLLGASLSWAGSLPSLGALGSTGHVVQFSANSCDPTTATCLPAISNRAGTGPVGAGAADPGNGHGAAMCKPPVNGSPKCGGGGPASQSGGDSGGVDAGGGNPINLLSGNKYQEETDLPALPGVLGLELKRYYNSRSSHPGLFGAQWRFSYETVLYDRGTQIQIIQADGRRISFAKKPGAALCDSPQWSDGQVRIEYPGDKPVFHWRWPDGRVLTFRSGLHGGYPLHAIRAPTGETSRLAYNPMLQLVSVTDPQNRQLLFIYDKASRLSAVITPLGRINYLQDTNRRLTEVGYIAKNQTEPYASRIYHYEPERQGNNGFSLTGISLQNKGDGKLQIQRLSTYAYNSDNLAVLSTQGLPLQQKDGKTIEGTGIEQVQLSYLQQPSPIEGRASPDDEFHPRSLGRTQLTNSLGQQTLIQSAIIGGHYRLIEMRGPGCATCGPSNMQYGYDREGRLLRSTRLDEQGRPLQSELRRYDRHGRLVEIADQRFAKGRPKAVQWIQRLEYTDTQFKDRSTALGNQPTLMSQPSVIAGKVRTLRVEYNDRGQPLRVTEEGWSPIDAQGRELAMAIERSTSYRYSVVGGNSVLTEIDGPLPNGPRGGPSDSDVSRLTWDGQGVALLKIEQPGGLVWDISNDPVAKRPRSITERWGSQSYRRTVTYDEFDRWVSINTEALNPTGQTSATHSELRRFDALTRSLELTRSDGEIFRISKALSPFFIEPNPNSNSQGIGIHEQRGPVGSLTEAIALELRTETRSAKRQLDDFGRLVELRLPGEAVAWAAYDNAGQLLALHRGDGSIRTLQYNLSGQLIRVDDTDKVEKGLTSSRILQWDGAYRTDEMVLDTAGKMVNRLHYQYDTWGHLLTQDLFLPEFGKDPIAGFRNQLDDHGRVIARRFNDGREVRLVTTEHDLEVREERAPVWLRDMLAWVPHDWWPTKLISRHELKTPVYPNVSTAVSKTTDVRPIESGLEPAEDQLLDTMGRSRSILHEGRTLILGWSVAGQLTEVHDMQHVLVAQYTYDARGRRVSKALPEFTEYYLYDGTQLVTVLRRSANAAKSVVTRHYIYSGFRAIAMLGENTGYQIDTDRRGAVTALYALRSPMLRWQPHANLWGQIDRRESHQSAAPDPELRLVNQWFDSEIGLHYNVARYYNPKTGRYLSTDPAGLADSIDTRTPASLMMDTTVYAVGQPLHYFDPDGAAKLTYYLIDGSPSDTNTADMRWGFWLREIAPGNTNQYLYDAGGSFLSSNANPLKGGVGTETNTNYARWTAKDLTEERLGNPIFAFVGYYLQNMQSPDAFTIDIADGAALQIAANLSQTGDILNKYYCAGEAKLVFKSVTWRGLTLSPGGIVGGHDDAPGARVEQGTDKVSCDDLQTPARAFERLKSAVIAQETGGKDCSSDGCPAGTKNPSGTPASYGSTQFVVATFVDRLINFGKKRPPSNNINAFYKKLFDQDASMTEEEKKTIGYLDQAGKDTGLIWSLLSIARFEFHFSGSG